MNRVPLLKDYHIRWIIAFFVSVIAATLFRTISPDRISGDFDVYYQAGRHFLDRAPMYEAHGGIEEFKYLPLFAMLFSPLSMLSELPALYLWCLLNIILFYSMFYFLHNLKLISFTRIRDLLIIALLLGLTGKYLYTNIRLGQVNIILGFLMLLTMYLEIKKKDLIAGAVLAFSLMIKFFPLFFLLYFFFTKRFKIVFATIVMMAIFLLLPALYSGLDLNWKNLQDWHALLRTSPANIFYSVKNFSLFSFFSWFFVARHEYYNIFDYNLITKGLTPEVYQAWMVSGVILLGAFYYDTIFEKGKDIGIKYLDYACLFVCGLLLNPLAYTNALILLTVPYYFILRFLFYPEKGHKYAYTVGFLLLVGLLLLIFDNRALFRDKWAYYRYLEYRPLTWTIMLAYLSLWLIKLSRYSSRPLKN